MITSIFIDSDILFNFLAMNPERKKEFELNGTTNSPDLDLVLKCIKELTEKDESICISNFSVLELLCTINRLKSRFKINEIFSTLSNNYNIININNNILQFSWYIGSTFPMHSGDAIHISFCLYNKIDKMLIKDKEFFNSIKDLRNHYLQKGTQEVNEFFKEISPSVKIPNFIFDALTHLKKIEISKMD